MKNIAVILLIAIGLAGAACSERERASAAERPQMQPSAERAPASEGDPCALVSSQDMAVMFGELKEGPTPSSGLRNERQCNYTNTAGSWIKLSLYAGTDRWEWEKGITNAQRPRSIGGLGDDAFAIQRGTDAVVYVRKGVSILELSCSCPADTAEAIARVVTTKL